MTRTAPLIYLVDDDRSMCRALERLLRSANFRVQVFGSAREFLDDRNRGGVCLILDLRMPGMTGLELQECLASSDPGLPVIFISGNVDERSLRLALEAGAAAFITKPFADHDLLGAVERAIGTH